MTTVRDVSKAILVSGRYVDDATCLVRAFAGQIMLARRGFPSEVKIGVAFTSEKALEGHAWVEFEGKVIIGYLPDLDRYSRMASPDFTSIRL